MDCATARPLLDLLVDEELQGAGEPASAVLGHLEGCPGCRALRDELDRVGARLRASEVPAASDWARLVETARRRPHLTWLAAVAAVVVACALPLALTKVFERKGELSRNEDVVTAVLDAGL